jgi:ABC-2 type transport system permease protein
VRFYNMLVKMIVPEIKSVIKDPMIFIVLFAGPILLTIFFGGVYVHNYLEDIPIAVLDEDNSSLSRNIIQQFDENERFYVKYYCTSSADLQDKIDSRKVYMGVYIPHNFSKDINKLKSSTVLVLVDGTNMVIGNNTYAAAANIVQTIAAGAQIKLLEAKGMLPGEAQNMSLTFQFNDRILYDPRLTYMNYLLLGFVAVFLQQVMLSSMGLSIVEDGKNLAQGNTCLKLCMKICAFSLFSVSATFIAIGIANLFYKVSIRGNLFVTLLMCILFVFAISCPAALLASLTRDKLKLYQLSFMLSLPTFVSSGYVWPLDQMPAFLPVVIKVLWPLIYFHKPFADVIFKGVPFAAVAKDIGEMLIYILCWMSVVIWMLKKRFGEANQESAVDSGSKPKVRLNIIRKTQSNCN